MVLGVMQAAQHQLVWRALLAYIACKAIINRAHTVHTTQFRLLAHLRAACLALREDLTITWAVLMCHGVYRVHNMKTVRLVLGTAGQA
jgi:hypothetical protein